MDRIELPFGIYRREAIHLFAAWMALALAFGNVLGNFNLLSVGVALMMTGVGFLAHELAQRYVARKNGFKARFEADRRTLGLVVLTSFLGFVFAAPGKTRMNGEPTMRQKMRINAAGPVANILLTLVFWMTLPGHISQYGYNVNAWLAFFNMIPVLGLDGEDIYRHNKTKFFALFGLSLFLVLVIRL